MIDVHLHVVPPELPGVGSLHPILTERTETVASVLRQQMREAGVTHALAMGSYSRSPEDPLGVASTLRIAERAAGLYAIGIANPVHGDDEHFDGVEAMLATGRIKALKAYLGYLHFPPDHPGYLPYYDLAARYQLPFVFHTGDTYSPYAKVRYAHPLLVDDVAVDHPNVRFVLAHVGNPWMIDAAEVVYKNMNVWTDLSGLAVGDEAYFAEEERQEALLDLIQNVQRAFRYAERPNRFLYGTDWPLAPMALYRDFIRAAIPKDYHQLVFEDNARSLFRL